MPWHTASIWETFSRGGECGYFSISLLCSDLSWHHLAHKAALATSWIGSRGRKDVKNILVDRGRYNLIFSVLWVWQILRAHFFFWDIFVAFLFSLWKNIKVQFLCGGNVSVIVIPYIPPSPSSFSNGQCIYSLFLLKAPPSWQQMLLKRSVPLKEHVRLFPIQPTSQHKNYASLTNHWWKIQPSLFIDTGTNLCFWFSQVWNKHQMFISLNFSGQISNYLGSTLEDPLSSYEVRTNTLFLSHITEVGKMPLHLDNLF